MGTLVFGLQKGSKLANALSSPAYQRRRQRVNNAFRTYEDLILANIVITDRIVKDHISHEDIPVGSKALRVEIVCGSTAYYSMDRAEELLKRLRKQIKKPLTRADLKKLWNDQVKVR